MIRVALRGLLGRKFRAILTALAVILGVAMISGTFVLTDTINRAFDSLFTDSYTGTDVGLLHRHRRRDLGRAGVRDRLRSTAAVR